MKYRLMVGDSFDLLASMPADSVDCVVTSPPYWGLRDYGVAGQLGLERSFPDYLRRMVALFGQVQRVLRPTGTLWVNMGDSYVTNDTTGTGWNSVINGKGTQIEAGKASRACRRNRATTGGLKHKDMVGQPWALAFALRDAGWFLRRDIIWHKPNPMPETVHDRPATAHEYVFMLTKSSRYHYDAEAVKEPVTGNTHARGHGVNAKIRRVPVSGWAVGPGDHSAVTHNRPRERQNASFSAAISGPVSDKRNLRSVWTIPCHPFKGAHFATYPERLVEPCILAGCPAGGVVLDPFTGSGTTGVVALRHGRRFLGVELNPEYAAMARARLDAAGQEAA